jgi:hypothetical protein
MTAEARCTCCRRVLPAESFGPRPAKRDGLASWCRECCREANRRWRAANREAYNAARRKGPTAGECVECGAPFMGHPTRLVCSRRCKDARYRRLHPDEYAAKQRRTQARRRAQEAGA